MKLGIISVPGIPSSNNVKSAASTPTFPLSIQKCMIEASGAQKISADSPKTGSKYVEIPIKSSINAFKKAIRRSDFKVFKLFSVLLSIFFIACKSNESNEHIASQAISTNQIRQTTAAKNTISTNQIGKKTIKKLVAKQVDDEALVEISDISINFDFDIKYASIENSFNTQLYPCSRCLLRFKVAKALILANEEFKKQGLHIKLFDCFRPVSVQRQMWSIIPNASYVKDPNSSPSMHNRGIAVDLTLVDENGNELDMGTSYDFFGRQAHQDFLELPINILENRRILRETLISFGFKSIRTEWWHYSYNSISPVSDSTFNCP